MKLRGRAKTFRGVWKQIVKGFKPELQEDGSVVLRQRKLDPSLRSQLRERAQSVDSTRIQSYLDACAKAPDASEGTKRKWKRALGL